MFRRNPVVVLLLATIPLWAQSEKGGQRLEKTGVFVITTTPSDPPSGQIKVYGKNDAGTDKLCSKNAAGTEACGLGGSGGGYDTIQDEASPLTQRTTVNFTGAGVSCADNPGSSRTDCTISGGGSGVTVEEADGVPSVSATIIQFDQADGFTVTDETGGQVQIDLVNAPDAAISDAITLTNITQITNRAITDTTGDLPLGTRTSGNYLEQITGGTGIVISGAVGEGATQTPAFDFTDAGADPALGTEECRFSNEGASAGGWVCEGGTADLIETRFRVTDPTVSDQIITFPNATGEVSLLGQSIALGTETTGNYVLDVADGTGIDGTASGVGATYTPTLDLTEVNSVTFGDNSQATVVHTIDPTGTTNPAWSYSDGVVNLTAGNLQEGGSDVLKVADQNAGTDITADLEEETHASEHTAGGTDIVTVDGTDAGAATTRTNENPIQISRHNTDCTSLTDGVAGELCHEKDANNLYICEPTAGGCDTPGEWVLTGDGSGAGANSFGTIGTAVADAPTDTITVTDSSTIDFTTTDNPEDITAIVIANSIGTAQVDETQAFVFSGLGATTITGGNLTLNDGVADSPSAIFVPQTGTQFNVFVDDTADDLRITAATASTENVEFENTGTGIMDVLVETSDGVLTSVTNAGVLTSGTLADARVAQSNVTQHQAALSVTASQISDQNAGTDITADLEEETHASEHTAGGTDIVTVDGTDAGAATTRTNENPIQISRHNTDCTSLTDGVAGELCHEKDANNLYICEPTAGGCDTAGEWVLTGDGSGAGANSFGIIGTATADAPTDTITITDSGTIDFTTTNDPEDLTAAIVANSVGTAQVDETQGFVFSALGATTISGGNLLLDEVTGNANNDAIGVTSTDGFFIDNGTAATSGNQQWSPRLRFTGQGWGVTPAASQTVDWIIENQPFQGTVTANQATANSRLVFSGQRNGGGYSPRIYMMDSGGNMGLDVPGGILRTEATFTFTNANAQAIVAGVGSSNPTANTGANYESFATFMQANSAFNYTSTFGGIRGTASWVEGNNTGLITEMVGVQSYADVENSGNVTALKLFEALTPDQFSTGAFQNVYGLYVRNQTAGAVANWSIFTESGNAEINTGAAGTVGLRVDGTTSQSANLQEWRDVTPTVVASVSPSGTIEGAVLTESSNAVPNATDNLSFFAATTSLQLEGVISDETGAGGALVFGSNPTLTDVVINDVAEFTESAGDPACAAGNYNIKGNSSTGKMRGCENGTLFDLNTAGGGNSFGTIGTAVADAGADTLTVTDSSTIDFTTTDNPEDLTAIVIADSITATQVDETSAFAFSALGATTVAGSLTLNDGVGDSPSATWTPQTGTSFSVLVADADDDLRITAATAATENVEFENTGTGLLAVFIETADGVLTDLKDTAHLTTGTLADARVDGSLEADELVLAGDVDGTANANDLDEAAVEAELEAVLDLADLQEKDIDSLTGQANWGTAATKETADLIINGVEVDFEAGAAEGYPRLAQSTVPPAADCDAAAEAGRLYFDTDLDTDGSVVVCRGAAGWKDIDDDGAGGGNGFGTIGTAVADAGADTITVTDSSTIDFTTTDNPEDLTAIVIADSITATQVDETSAFAFSALGATVVAGSLTLNDGVTDSPSATWTPQTGTSFSVLVADADDDLRVTAATTATENVEFENTGTGVMDVLVETSDGVLTSVKAGESITSGTVDQARLDANVVMDNEANTWSTGAQSFSAATSLTLPVSAGANPTANGDIAYDSTANQWEVGDGGVNRQVVLHDKTQTLSGKTVDESNNTILLSSYVTYDAAGCQAGTGFSGFTWDSTDAPASVNCIDGTNVDDGSISFADAVTDRIHGSFLLPPDFTTGSGELFGVWRSATASTNTVRFTLETRCVADAEVIEGAWNTAQNIDDAGKGTTLQTNSFNLTSVTQTGCAASEIFYWRFSRLGADAADTFAGSADLLQLRFRIRRSL